MAEQAPCQGLREWQWEEQEDDPARREATTNSRGPHHARRTAEEQQDEPHDQPDLQPESIGWFPQPPSGVLRRAVGWPERLNEPIDKLLADIAGTAGPVSFCEPHVGARGAQSVQRGASDHQTRSTGGRREESRAAGAGPRTAQRSDQEANLRTNCQPAKRCGDPHTTTYQSS